MPNIKNKVILTVAPTGSSTTRTQAPNIPMTPKQIAEDAYECWKAGASIVHLHVRDDQEKACMSYEKFKEAIERIRDKCDIVGNFLCSVKLFTRIPGLNEFKQEFFLTKIYKVVYYT